VFLVNNSISLGTQKKRGSCRKRGLATSGRGAEWESKKDCRDRKKGERKKRKVGAKRRTALLSQRGSFMKITQRNPVREG